MLSLDRQNRLREIYRRQAPGWRPATEVYGELVRQHLQPADRLLDWGCGRGGLVEQLQHPLTRCVGIDPDWQSLRTHRLALPRAVGRGAALPFANSSFDLILGSWVLEHLATPADDLAQIARVLRPGGRLIFITPNRRHPLIILNRALSRLHAGHHYLITRLYGRAAEDTFPAFYRANDPVTLTRLAAGASLRLERWCAIPDPTYLALRPAWLPWLAWGEARLPADRRLHLVGVMQRPT